MTRTQPIHITNQFNSAIFYFFSSEQTIFRSLFFVSCLFLLMRSTVAVLLCAFAFFPPHLIITSNCALFQVWPSHKYLPCNKAFFFFALYLNNKSCLLLMQLTSPLLNLSFFFSPRAYFASCIFPPVHQALAQFIFILYFTIDKNKRVASCLYRRIFII